MLKTQRLKRTRWITAVFLFVGLAVLLAQPILASDLPAIPETETLPIPQILMTSDGLVLPSGDLTIDGIGWCPSNANICRVNRQWTVAEIRAQLGNNKWAVWQDDRQLTFAFRGHVPEVFVAAGFHLELMPIENSDYWAATVQIGLLDQAVISYMFGTVKDNTYQIIQESYGVWRGKRAPQEPEKAESLQGYMDTAILYSSELDELRPISYYLPPNYSFRQAYPVVYMTNGQSLQWFAQVVEPLIQQRLIPPMIIVGVFPAPYEGAHNRQAEEYLLGISDAAYLAHEQFFTETVRRWAELRLHASEDPSQRAIMGYSMGSTFAGNTGIRKPDTYGHIMMLSPSQIPLINLRSQVSARYYLAAGTLEPPVYSIAQRFHFNLLLLNVESRFRQRVSGHDGVMWQEELPNALRWMFAETN